MKVKRKLIFLTLTVFILSLFSIFPIAAEESENSFIVRIVIKRGVNKLKLYIPGGSKAYAPYSKKQIFSSNKNLLATVKPTTYGLKLDDKKYNIFGLKFIPLHKKKFFINNMPYKGKVLILRTKDKKLMVINYVSLYKYLKGVLYNEISHWWPMETIKAQAVAARTYAVYKCKNRNDKPYDMSAGVASQVYKGVNSERYRTTVGIKTTKGEILTYKGKVFPAFYHACCGGQTEESEEVWSIDLPVLKSVKDPFCKKSPYYNWRVILNTSELEKKFKHSGFQIGKILNISILERDNSGRIKKIFVVGSKSDFLITGQKFRSIVGYDVIRSTMFTVLKDNNKYEIRGHGWGHGVGLCQWGAYYMGKKGYNYNHILNHYYPGATLKSLMVNEKGKLN